MNRGLEHSAHAPMERAKGRRRVEAFQALLHPQWERGSRKSFRASAASAFLRGHVFPGGCLHIQAVNGPNGTLLE